MKKLQDPDLWCIDTEIKKMTSLSVLSCRSSGHTCRRQLTNQVLWQQGCPVAGQPSSTSPLCCPRLRSVVRLSPWPLCILTEPARYATISRPTSNLILNTLLAGSGTCWIRKMWIKWFILSYSPLGSTEHADMLPGRGLPEGWDSGHGHSPWLGENWHGRPKCE